MIRLTVICKTARKKIKGQRAICCSIFTWARSLHLSLMIGVDSSPLNIGPQPATLCFRMW